MNAQMSHNGWVEVPSYSGGHGRQDLRAEGKRRLERAMVNEKLAHIHAEDAINRLLAAPHPDSRQAGHYLMDWAVTMLFYSALQYMDAVLIGCNGWHSPSHEQQDNNIRRDPALRPLLKRFVQLRNASVKARYNPCGGNFAASRLVEATT